jgi:hypothetical protein
MADSINEIRSVQTPLANVRTDIEKIEGRMRFLENRSAMATITVHIQTPELFAANSAGLYTVSAIRPIGDLKRR